MFYDECISIPLSADFDLYLMRPHRDDIALNPSREIADYGIKKAVREHNVPFFLSLTAGSVLGSPSSNYELGWKFGNGVEVWE